MSKKQPPAAYVKPKHIHEWDMQRQDVYSSQVDGTVTVQEIRVQTCSCGAMKVLTPGPKRKIDAEPSD